MAKAGIRAKRLALRAPNTNAYVERFIQSIQVECLDHFLVFGEKHFDYLVGEYVKHYHMERPHQGLGNRTPMDEALPDQQESTALGEVRSRGRLGGLPRHYERAAA
jgi:putative transposase